MVIGVLLENPPHLLACLLGATVAAVGAGEVDTGECEVGRGGEHLLENRNALASLVLREQRRGEEGGARGLTGPLRGELTEPRFRGRRLPGAQRRMRPQAALRECGWYVRGAHGSSPGGERG